MKVLSLFDGMSCGRIALDRLGIAVDTYYASEIDKYAIEVAQKNYPDTIHVGDVTQLNADDFQDVDLILAGSPCQGFSFAGNQLAFDDPRSALFFEFIRLLKAIKPKYFLLENVRMKKEFLEVITEQVSSCYPEFQGHDLFGGRIEPILINSSLVSAQSRERYYWTNIPNITQPEDKGIVLRDVLEEDPGDSFNLAPAKVDRVLNEARGKGFFYNEDSPKIGTIIAGYHKEPTDGSYIVSGAAFRGRAYDKCGKRMDRDGDSVANKTKQMLELRQDRKSNAITTVYKDSVVVSEIREKSKTVRSGGRDSYDRHEWDSVDELHWRKLTPLECERLQTVPDNYTNHVSNTQRYKMLGNGWTVDVIAHILNNMENL
jgi:DNA-cytosine methyltransferase